MLRLVVDILLQTLNDTTLAPTLESFLGQAAISRGAAYGIFRKIAATGGLPQLKSAKRKSRI